MQSYVVIVRLMKLGDSDVNYKNEYSNRASEEFRDLAKMATQELNRVYMSSEVKDNYIGSDVVAVNKTLDGGEGVLVNFTVRLTNKGGADVDEDLLKDELIKRLEESPSTTVTTAPSTGSGSESLPTAVAFVADVEDVLDFDECSDERYNDCHSAAVCVNEPGKCPF